MSNICFLKLKLKSKLKTNLYSAIKSEDSEALESFCPLEKWVQHLQRASNT